MADYTTKPIAQLDSTSTYTTVSSSEDDSENDKNQLTAPVHHPTILTPQLRNKPRALTSPHLPHDAEGVPQDIITINEQDRDLHREINISDNTGRRATSKEIRINMQSPTTITITHRDLNNNDQASAKTISPTQQQATKPSISTRRGCDGTLYRLSPMGRINNPMQQKSPCHTHNRNTAPTTTVPTWELTQTQDPQGIDNFHQYPDGRLAITSRGKPRCNYCKLPNHERQRCPFRLKDLQHNIDKKVTWETPTSTITSQRVIKEIEAQCP